MTDENKIVGSKFKADKMFPRSGWVQNYRLTDENKIVGSKFKADKMFPRNGWAQNYCLSDKKRWQMVKQ